MKNDSCKKIAIIHYGWYFQEHGKLLAEGFLTKGDRVDLHLYNVKESYASLPISDRCKIIKRESKNVLDGFLGRVLHTLYRRCSFLRKAIDRVYDAVFILEARKFNCSNSYDLIIGVEKGGGFLAYKFSQVECTPFVYYSLELSDKQDFSYELFLGAMARKENCVVRHASGVILQDASRAEFFLQRYHAAKIILLPVSVKKMALRPIGRQRKCISFGNNHFFKEDDFLQIAHSLPSGWQVVLHNQSLVREKEIIGRLGLKNIIVSEGCLNEHDICLLLSSASIGLAFYGDRDENVKRIIFSSEKVARYLSFDLPIITNDLGNAHLLFEEIACGVALSNIQNIGCEIERIEKKYQEFSSAAKNAFEKYYNFDTNFERIYPQLTALVCKKM